MCFGKISRNADQRTMKSISRVLWMSCVEKRGCGFGPGWREDRHRIPSGIS